MDGPLYTVQNYCKLIDFANFVDRNLVNSSNFNAMILKFSEKFDYHRFSRVLNLVTCSLRVMVSLLCRSKGRTISSPFPNYLTNISYLTNREQ